MDSLYQMEITVINVQVEDYDKIIEAISGQWDWDIYYHKNEVVATGEDYLNNKEGEERFSKRVTELIWDAVGKFVPISIVATLIIPPSHNMFEYNQDTYKQYKEKQ